jgi:hypothetical protein
VSEVRNARMNYTLFPSVPFKQIKDRAPQGRAYVREYDESDRWNSGGGI